MNNLKKWRNVLMIGLFIFTFIMIGMHLYFENLPKIFSADEKTLLGQESWEHKCKSVVDVDLGEVEIRGFNHMGSIRAYMDFSADEKRLAIGTDSGEILLLQTEDGKILWRQQVGIGKITALAFSPDGQSIYVGETSPEGRMICLESQTGKVTWNYKTVEDIGVDLKHGSLPGTVKIICDQEKNVYFLSKRYENDQNGKIVYRAKIFCFDEQGEKKWAMPNASNLDAWVDWISVDEKMNTLVFGTANVSGMQYEFADSLYYVNAKTGEIKNSVQIAGIVPYEKTAMRGSPNISVDGNFVSAMASDGRASLYDGKGTLLWKRTLSEPKKFGDVYLNAVGRDAFIIKDYVVFSTLNTYNSANWQLPTPVEHPSSNSIYVFNKTGEFLYQWKAGGAVEDVAFAYPYAAIAVGKNTKTKNVEVHGLRLLNLETGEIEVQIPTKGPNIAAAISKNGTYIAAVEVPLKKNDGTVVGTYTLHLLRNEERKN